MRFTPNAWCSGYSAISVMAVVQFGLAMMPLCQLHILGVDLRHDQRDVLVLAEGAGIVHHHAAGLGRNGSEFLRDAAAGAEQRDVNALERILGQFRHGDVLALEFQFFADRTRGGEQGELAHGKISFFQGLDHLDADGASGTDNCDVWIAIHKRLKILAEKRAASISAARCGTGVRRETHQPAHIFCHARHKKASPPLDNLRKDGRKLLA